MEIKIVKTQEEAGQIAKDIFAETLQTGREVFGLATGSTPETTYVAIADSDLDFSQATAINLDEYIGIGPDHPQSYNYFMDEHLFKFKDFKHHYLPNGLSENDAEETARYDALLEANPRDLQLLGIGVNGHIAFNEPGTPFDSTTHVTELTKETIQANKRFFEKEEDVPRKAYSMGIKSILDAKRIVLLAFGKEKAQAVKDLIEHEVTEEIPATALQTHPNVTVIIDEDAASLLSK